MPEQTNRIRISNIASLEKDNISRGILDQIKFKFCYENPKFAESLRLGFSNFQTPQTVDLYEDGEDAISFPRGLVGKLSRLVPNIEIEDNTSINPVEFPPSEITLRPYQEKAVAALMGKNQGTLDAPVASGKTIMMIELAVRRGQKTLILTHTRDLKSQWQDRFKKFTGIEPGLIDDSNFDYEGPVTIGMVQSLNARKLTPDFLSSFGCVILDECHHAPAFTFKRLMNLFPARFRYGCTGTLKRRDGLGFMIDAAFGPVIHTIQREELFSEGQIMQPIIKAIHTSCYLPECNDYRTLIDAVTGDADRNHLILKHLIQVAEAGHSCLVLSERINHIEDLSLIFSTLCSDTRSEILTSKVPKTERKRILQDADEGLVKVLFGTKLADEGLDIPRLDRLFLTCPVRSGSKVTQQVGRIMRTFPGKVDARVYDFIDKNISLAWSQWLTRKREAYSDFQIEELSHELTS